MCSFFDIKHARNWEEAGKRFSQIEKVKQNQSETSRFEKLILLARAHYANTFIQNLCNILFLKKHEAYWAWIFGLFFSHASRAKIETKKNLLIRLSSIKKCNNYCCYVYGERPQILYYNKEEIRNKKNAIQLADATWKIQHIWPVCECDGSVSPQYNDVIFIHSPI